MSQFSTITALNSGIVARLGAVLGKVADLVTITASSVGWIFGLSTVAAGMARLLAVAADHHTWFLTIRSLMTFFATVMAGKSLGIWAVLRKVSNLLAAATLDSLGRARLRAVASGMARLLAIPAGEPIHAFLLAVASTVSNLVANSALDLDTNGEFGNLLLASLLDVSLN
jgi:hypothetical protein